MTTQENHQQVMEIVATVLERAPEERAAFLAERCGDDKDLRKEVDSYLEYEDKTAAFSGEPYVYIRPPKDPPPEDPPPEDPPPEDPPPEEPGPERIGPYQVLKRLGRGGMGEVYLARQEEPIRRQVALKLITKGLDSEDIVHRFRQERNILANLRHPYIACLLDGGASEDGRPYFAMEYVDGQPIDEYCDANRLSIRDRLELVRKVCSAVQLAHQNLVVHRDLKPGNILVDASGTPKLLDFGIAKLLRSESDEQTVFVTATDRGPMTREYASPEMVGGEVITTASDIYSLGVVLYRLLSGHHPYQVRGRSFAAIDRAIRQEEPKRPSTMVGRTDELRGEDGIVYQLTPGAVSRRRGSDPARLQRLLSGDLDCIMLKALRKEPRERYGSVVELSEDIRRHLEGLPVAARADTFRYRTGKFVRRQRWGLATAAAFSLMVFGFVAALLFQVERIRTERDRANMSHDLFVEIVETTDPQEEEDVLTPQGVVKRGIDHFGESFAQEHEVQASVFDSLGRVYARRGYYESARPLLETSLEMRRKALGNDHLLVAESRLNLAYLLGKLGEYEAAAEHACEGLAIQRGYYQGAHIELARSISNCAAQLNRIGRRNEAKNLCFESYEMRVALYGEIHLSVATSLDVLGTLHKTANDFEEALQHYSRALDIRRELLLPPKHPEMALSYSHIGTLLYQQGAFAEAVPKLRQALAIRREHYGNQHSDVATSGYRLANALRRMGEYEEAEPLFRQALDVRCRHFGDEHPKCAIVKRNLAKLLVARGDVDAAEPLLAEALEAFMDRGPRDRTAVAITKSVLGQCLAARGRYEEAEELMLESHRTILDALGKESIVTQETRHHLNALYEDWEKPEKAEEYRKL